MEGYTDKEDHGEVIGYKNADVLLGWGGWIYEGVWLLFRGCVLGGDGMWIGLGMGVGLERAYLYSNLVFYFAHIRIQCTCLEAAIEFVVVPSRSSRAFYSASERHILTMSRSPVVSRHYSTSSTATRHQHPRHPPPAMEEPPLNAVNPLPSYHSSPPCRY